MATSQTTETSSYSPVIIYKYGDKKLFVYDPDDTSKCYIYYLKRPLVVDECKKMELAFDISDLDFIDFVNETATLYDKNTADETLDKNIDIFIDDFYDPNKNHVKYVIKALPKITLPVSLTSSPTTTSSPDTVLAAKYVG